MDAETIGHIMEGFPLPIQRGKHIHPDGREQDFSLPVVPKLEDFRERKFSWHTKPLKQIALKLGILPRLETERQGSGRAWLAGKTQRAADYSAAL